MPEIAGNDFRQNNIAIAHDAADALGKAVADPQSPVTGTIYKNQEGLDATLDAYERKLGELELDELLKESGVFGRRGLEAVAKMEAMRIKGRRHGAKGWLVVMVDMDGLKQINDRAGHIAGDAMLVGLAEVLRKLLRETDIIGRYGGDEIVLLLSVSDYKKALKAMMGTPDESYRGLERRMYAGLDKLRVDMKTRFGDKWPEDTESKKPGQASIGWHFFSAKDYLKRYRKFLKSSGENKKFVSILIKEADEKMYSHKHKFIPTLPLGGRLETLSR